MRMKPGLEVVCLGAPRKGQVTCVKNGMCQVVWPGDRRESHPQSDLAGMAANLPLFSNYQPLDLVASLLRFLEKCFILAVS
jgi:hypothetical protein